MQLSEIETINTDTNLSNFELKPLIDDVFDVLEKSSGEKGVYLKNSTLDKVQVCANKNRMKQLLLNLVENGIKYNRTKGTVEVIAFTDKGKVIIKVKDTGIGIPSEDLSRIFERFYRVDKARSRDMGGTGLGLSIVKHIVNLYNGDISVNSEIDKGSEFIVQIPSI